MTSQLGKTFIGQERVTQSIPCHVTAPKQECHKKAVNTWWRHHSAELGRAYNYRCPEWMLSLKAEVLSCGLIEQQLSVSVSKHNRNLYLCHTKPTRSIKQIPDYQAINSRPFLHKLLLWATLMKTNSKLETSFLWIGFYILIFRQF